MITVKDANGKWVVINEIDLQEALVAGQIRIFDIEFGLISIFREVYIEKRGPLPMTAESIRKTLS